MERQKMKTKKILSGVVPGWFGVVAVFLAGFLLSGCYTVLKNSSEYYSEFDTSNKKREIKRDTLIVQNEWETEEYADSVEYPEEEYVEETAGGKTVIINRYYNDPWFSWNNYNPYYYPHYGWRVTIGWGAWPAYYDPYWYNPYWHSGYYWGWCCYPGYYDPWYPPRWSGGGNWGYSHYQRRDYGMRRYQLNPVTSGGLGAFKGGGSRATATGAVQTTGSASGGRTYRDPNTTATGAREGSETGETTRSDNQRKSRSNEKIKSGRGGTKVKSGRTKAASIETMKAEKRTTIHPGKRAPIAVPVPIKALKPETRILQAAAAAARMAVPPAAEGGEDAI